MAICPECETDLDVDQDQLKVGEILVCPECGAELEVRKLGPLVLGKFSEEEEDWGDDNASP